MALFLALAEGVAAQETATQAMAQAIARMMETMGFIGNGVSGMAPGNFVPGNPGSMGMAGWPSAFVPGAAGTGSQSSQAPGGAVLEGVWEDNQNGLLIVQGTLYRIYSSCNGYIEGDIRIGSDRIELTNRKESFTQTFEFALDQGRLALRDQNGQTYLYRRLVLDRASR